MITVYDKNGNEVNIIDKSNCKVFIGNIKAQSQVKFSLPNDGVYFVFFVNSYNVGSVYVVQTGQQGNIKLSPIVSSTYFTLSLDGRNIIAKSRDASAGIYYTKLGII